MKSMKYLKEVLNTSEEEYNNSINFMQDWARETFNNPTLDLKETLTDNYEKLIAFMDFMGKIRALDENNT